MTGKTTITPGEFQEICDRAVLALELRRWPADAAPYDISRAVIAEIHGRVRRHLGEDYEGHDGPVPPNERWIEEIVETVSRHWSGPIMVERVINETIRMVIEHWREHHHPGDAIERGG